MTAISGLTWEDCAKGRELGGLWTKTPWRGRSSHATMTTKPRTIRSPIIGSDACGAGLPEVITRTSVSLETHVVGMAEQCTKQKLTGPFVGPNSTAEIVAFLRGFRLTTAIPTYPDPSLDGAPIGALLLRKASHSCAPSAFAPSASAPSAFAPSVSAPSASASTRG
jgi:hypothetical protein